MFGFQQRTNMETNKGSNWLEAIAISNYETMSLGARGNLPSGSILSSLVSPETIRPVVTQQVCGGFF
jgi:hypothetical protein